MSLWVRAGVGMMGDSIHWQPYFPGFQLKACMIREFVVDKSHFLSEHVPVESTVPDW